MTGSTRLWDAHRQENYVQERDRAIRQRADERSGEGVARSIDALWVALADDERATLEYLMLANARGCIGRCNDPTLARLVEKGLLIWPPGVRPVLTDDLVTSFLVPPAVGAALDARRDSLLPPPDERRERLRAAAAAFAERIDPIAARDAPDPVPPEPFQTPRGR